jgi:uncharacterized protein (TIGR02145 family)
VRTGLLCWLLIASILVHAQPGTFTDKRDGNIYSTITIGNKTWFREHLRLKTSLSYFPNFNKDTTELKYGNYYSNNEVHALCPEGWHVATIPEFEEYLAVLARQRNIPDSAIVRNIFPKDSSAFISLGNMKPLRDTLMNFVPIGWVEGNKINKGRSLTMWMKDSRTNDDKFHVHIGSLGYVIHTHIHNVIDKPKRIRKFTVRCVCDVK